MNVRLVISGRVQGVFFRQSAKNEAEKLGITGWIRNNPDGTVEIEAQGDHVQLEEFIKWCKKGPQFANVNNLDVEWRKKQKNFEDFKIT